MSKSDNDKLYKAVQDDNLDEVKSLVKYAGASVNCRTEFGWTPLMSAAINGNIELMEYLLSEGAHVNAKNYSDDSVLMKAASGNQAEAIKLLVKHGAKLDMKCGEHQETALIKAAYGSGRKEAVLALLSAGANPTIKNILGKTAADVTGDAEVRKIILEFTIKTEQKELDGISGCQKNNNKDITSL